MNSYATARRLLSFVWLVVACSEEAPAPTSQASAPAPLPAAESPSSLAGAGAPPLKPSAADEEALRPAPAMPAEPVQPPPPAKPSEPPATKPAEEAPKPEQAPAESEAEPAQEPAGDDKVPANAARGNALTHAYEALTRGERSRAPELVAALDAHSAANPDDDYAVFYSGAFRLWSFAETLDFSAASAGLDALQRAHERLPNDFRVTGFFGMMQVTVGGLTDPALLERGLQTLELAVQQEPIYGHFLRATAVTSLAASHPAFKTALSDMESIETDCQITVDGEGVYHYPPEKLASRPRVCANDSIVPHAWEGFFLSFGDIALKSGVDAARARAIYRSAQTAPTYDRWPFKAELEKRITAAEDSAAAYRDANPFNDPVPWSLDGNICVGCHQK